MLVYCAIFGVVWCGRVRGTMEDKMLGECWGMFNAVFVVKLIVYI